MFSHLELGTGDHEDARVVVVTGSASGIGRAVVAAFLHEGAHVIGLDRSEQRVQDGERFTPIEVDLADGASLTNAWETVRALHGRVDVLVTSAAIGFPEPFAEITAETWERVQRVNVTGVVRCLQEALPVMQAAGRGSVVVLSSIAGRTRSVANGAHYTASKYALIGLVRHVAAELAGTGVRVNCVAPGPTNTAFLVANSTGAERERIAEQIPLRRIAEPEDVAEVVLFVASERARHVHGAVIDVNGGSV